MQNDSANMPICNYVEVCIPVENVYNLNYVIKWPDLQP